MNLSDLRYLVALAEQRHFGRAAEACFVSQPTLSTQIRKLERELGVELVERNPRQVLLTNAGAAVVERARVAVHEADAIRSIARAAADPESASVRLGAFPTLGPYLLPHIVPAIHRRLPRVELLLTEDKSANIIDRLHAGDLDIGLLAAPIADDRLVGIELFTEDFLLAVPKGHPLASTEGLVDMNVLSGNEVMLLDDGHCLRDQALSVCSLVGAHERRGFRATSLETLRQMVAAGVGITLLPELAVAPPVSPNPDIVLLRFRDPAPSRTIALYRRTSSPMATLAELLAGLIISATGQLDHVRAA